MNPGVFIQVTAKTQKHLGIAAVPLAGGWCTHCKQQAGVSSLSPESSEGQGPLWE